jgi:hypothetical protein
LYLAGVWPEADVIHGREAAGDFYLAVVEAASGRPSVTLNS